MRMTPKRVLTISGIALVAYVTAVVTACSMAHANNGSSLFAPSATPSAATAYDIEASVTDNGKVVQSMVYSPGGQRMLFRTKEACEATMNEDQFKADLMQLVPLVKKVIAEHPNGMIDFGCKELHSDPDDGI